MDLTVGMAVYDDFDGIWPTIASVRECGPSDIELVIVDNAPVGCARTRDVTRAAGGRYFHLPNLHGTGAPRDEVFRRAESDWVLCCDSHVTFGRDALFHAAAYARGAPGSRDIVGGPLVYDNGTATTHWTPTTPPGLWGVWWEAWYDPASGTYAEPTLSPATAGGALRAMGGGDPPAPLAAARFRWDQKDAALRGLGLRPAADPPHGPPFEIPMMGLGVWMMRRAAWPGFNPLFTGFGGEEGYIHEVTRRRGGRALCLPALRWRHKFRDPLKAPPYPTMLKDHVWNLLVGHREVGIDAVEAIRKDFGSRLESGVFDGLVRGAAGCQPWDAPGVRPAPMKILGVWYTNNAAPPKLLTDSLGTIARAKEVSRADVRVTTCPWEPVAGNPFPEASADLDDRRNGHLNIVRQIRACVAEATKDGWAPDAVCFLEHDVLYPPDYFDRVQTAFRQNPTAPVVSNGDYEGLNATGWLTVRERHEPMHQLSMRSGVAAANLDRAEAEAVATGQALLEPQGDRRDWARLPARGLMPAVHVNHARRFTSHGEVVFNQHSNGRVTHRFWGNAADWWHADYAPLLAAGCGACPGAAPQSALGPPVAALVHPRQPPEGPPDVESWYEHASATAADFREHMPTLRDLASKVGRVTEVSGWHKPALLSAAAGLSAGGTVTSVCHARKPEWVWLRRLLGERFTEVVADQPPGIPETDLLILDTLHTADRVYRELSRYAPASTHYVVVHCTETYGEHGDGGGPGVLPALRRYLSEHPEWSVVRYDRNNHGLIVLSRDPRDKPDLPGRARMAWNFAKASARHWWNGSRLLPVEMAEERLKHCWLCPIRSGNQCTKCGCYLDQVPDDSQVNAGSPGKAFYPREACPIGKWHAVPNESIPDSPVDGNQEAK